MKKPNIIKGKKCRYISEIPEVEKNGFPRGFLNKMQLDVGGIYSVLSSKLNYVMRLKCIANNFFKVWI